MNRKRLPYIFLISVIFLGIGILIYPHLRQIIYKDQAKKINRYFEQEVKTAALHNERQYTELYNDMVSYNQTIYSNNQEELTDARIYENIDFSMKDYGFADELFGYITIPAMDIELPIYLGANKENLNIGATHLSKTSMSIGGENTNSVIAAHRGMATAEMFRDIEELKVDDRIFVTNLWEKLEYKVTRFQIVSPNNREAILIQDGKDMLTLVTCHPFRSNRQRYLVYCERV